MFYISVQNFCMQILRWLTEIVFKREVTFSGAEVL